MKRLLMVAFCALLLSAPFAVAQRPAIWSPVGSGVLPPSEQYQSGSVALAIGTQSYAVVFSPALTGAPTNVTTQVWMVNADGEILYANVRADTVTASGFTLVLSGSPVATGGSVKWIAQL